MLTRSQIEEARNWLDEQRAVRHPGPIETIRDALSMAMHRAIDDRPNPFSSEGSGSTYGTQR